MTEDADRERDPEEDGADDTGEIPLQIADHGERQRPDEAAADGGVLAASGETAQGTETAAEPSEGDPGAGATPSTAGDADTAADGDDEEVEPVEVLVTLAEDGEIDPWDIDIVAVTDKFLDRLDEADLRSSGRALFYASVLLRMKGDAMLADDDPEDEPWDEPWEQQLVEDAPAESPEVDPFAALEDEMDRRLERKRARGMPQTLDELVHDLRDAERDSWWKASREYDTRDSPWGFQRGTQELDYRRGDDLRMDDEPSAEDVTGTAHEEDIDEIIADVSAQLQEQYDQGRAEVLYREIETAGGSRVETFLGLLFLSHRGQVRLDQDDLFGDLWIKDPTAETSSPEAVAD